MTTPDGDSEDQRATISQPARRAARRGSLAIDARELFEMALLMVALLANDVLLPRVLYGDGLVRYCELDRLLNNGLESYCQLGQSGPSVNLNAVALATSRYSLIGPIFAAPLWWLGHLSGGELGAGAETQRYNALLFGLAMVALYLILRRHMDGRLLRAFLLLLALASMVPYHLTQFYG
jgi:hypothetical protein